MLPYCPKVFSGTHGHSLPVFQGHFLPGVHYLLSGACLYVYVHRGSKRNLNTSIFCASEQVFFKKEAQHIHNILKHFHISKILRLIAIEECKSESDVLGCMIHTGSTFFLCHNYRICLSLSKNGHDLHLPSLDTQTFPNGKRHSHPSIPGSHQALSCVTGLICSLFLLT